MARTRTEQAARKPTSTGSGGKAPPRNRNPKAARKSNPSTGGLFPPPNVHVSSSCKYYYRYTPPASAFSRAYSLFELSCNFQELAEKYPEFRNAWANLRQGRQRKKWVQHAEAPHFEQKRTNGNLFRDDQISDEFGIQGAYYTRDNTRDESKYSDSTATAPTINTFSAHITHSFNAALTRSVLHHHFQLQIPSLPHGRICPPIPNRSNYVCWLKELMVQSAKDLYRFSTDTSGTNPENGDAMSLLQRRGIDIGTGVSAIYPLLLTTNLFSGSDAFTANQRRIHTGNPDNYNDKQKSNEITQQWKFLATDIDPMSIQSAQINVQANRLGDQICVVKVEDSGSTMTKDKESCNGPLFAAMEEAKKQPLFQTCCPKNGTGYKLKSTAEYPKFDFVMTNPPFYSTLKEATAFRAGDKRSRTDMSANEGVYIPASRRSTINGSDMELDEDCDAKFDGGDVGFVTAIMHDSQLFRNHVTWYTSLIAKRASLDALLQKLQTLDGVWGNQGQVRTVEFHQKNLDRSERIERRGKNRSPRVRWGIGWTYERASGRCSVCRLNGGLQSFEVWICVSDDTNCGQGADGKAKRASDEVTFRLVDYFEKRQDFSLRSSCHTIERGIDAQEAQGKWKRCVTILEERFFNCNPSLLPVLDPDNDNSNLPYEGHFIIDAHVESSGECSGSGNVRVQVILEMYSHTKRGRAIIDKIRDPLPGEIGRTNRRWRRFLEMQSAS